MRAKDNLDHLSRILQSYGKDCSNVLCLVGDNCSINQSMARTLNVPLIGCASHKFNIAVEQWIALQPKLTPNINKVSPGASWLNVVCCCLILISQPVYCWLSRLSVQASQVIKKASTLEVASQLCELTSYNTVCENDTRWSSTYNMIDRYLCIQTELSSVVDLLSLLPNHLELDFLTRVHVTMEKFDSIAVMLQRDGMTFVEPQ